MSKLIIHRKQSFGIKLSIPYYVKINGNIVCATRSDCLQIQLPSASYNIGISYIFSFKKWNFTLSSERNILIHQDETVELEFYSRERIWNILFDIDLLLWIAELFFNLLYPWNIIYKILSNGFFVAWIIRLWLIRDRYFVISRIET